MAHLGDAAIQFPVSGSYNPRVYMRTVCQATSGTLFIVSSTLSGTLAVPANPNRIGMVWVNDSPEHVYVGYGFMPDSWSYTAWLHPLDKGSPSVDVHVHEHTGPVVYTGPIYVRWITDSGSLKITELT